jgi:hypothetical protein
MDKNDSFKRLVAECEAMMAECGFVLPKITYSLSSRMYRSIGRCRRKRINSEYRYFIILADCVYTARLNNKEINEIKQTILHEQCHALPNGMNHGDGWKKYVNIINRKYGYNIKRHTDMDDTIRNATKDKRPAVRYIIICEGCGAESRYKRKPKLLDYLHECSCKRCKAKKFKVVKQ